MAGKRGILTEYECGNCGGEGEIYKEERYVGICVECNGSGVTNKCWEDD